MATAKSDRMRMTSTACHWHDHASRCHPRLRQLRCPRRNHRTATTPGHRRDRSRHHATVRGGAAAARTHYSGRTDALASTATILRRGTFNLSGSAERDMLCPVNAACQDSILDHKRVDGVYLTVPLDVCLILPLVVGSLRGPHVSSGLRCDEMAQHMARSNLAMALSKNVCGKCSSSMRSLHVSARHEPRAPLR